MLMCALPLSESGIEISSSHSLVAKKLLLSFKIKCVERETSIFPFRAYSSGLSPNDFCNIVLYDAEMRTIDCAQLHFSLYSRSPKSMHVKLYPDSTIRFVCEVDTANLKYKNTNLNHDTVSRLEFRKVIYKNISFYKMFYHGPRSRPRKAISDLESPLFSLK